MTWYRDLAPCPYFHLGKTKLKAVGWLARGHRFPTGQLDPEVREHLDGIIRISPVVVVYRGLHSCDFCPDRDPGFPGSFANYFIPGIDVVYAVPAMIRHYIDAHQYLPPEEFCEAVINCPLGSAAYEARIAALEPVLLRYRWSRLGP